MYDKQKSVWENCADRAAYDAIRGRGNSAIIKHDSVQHIIVYDMAEDHRVWNSHDIKSYYEGYLVITYTVDEARTQPTYYPSIDKHYVRKSSAYQRYRNLGGMVRTRK